MELQYELIVTVTKIMLINKPIHSFNPIQLSQIALRRVPLKRVSLVSISTY